LHAAAIALVSMFALGACANASPEQERHAAAATHLSGAELATTLPGNTLSGASKSGSTFVEYYDPDGEIRGLWKGTDRYLGRWAIRGDTFCADYEGTEDDYCAILSLNGSEMYWLKADGSVENADRPARLITGNPNNF
jgi:hypothetical protein